MPYPMKNATSRANGSLLSPTSIRAGKAGNGAAATAVARAWDVEICLAEGGILRARTAASDSRRAVESALSRSAIPSSQVAGVAVQPLWSGEAA